MSIKLYQEELMDHFKNPRNYGKLENPDFSGEDDNPSCGDRISITGLVENGQITDIQFEGKGCVLSQATTSMLTEHLKGKSVEEAASLTEKDILEMVGLELGPVRMKCALLPFMVLKNAIERIK